MAMKPPKVTGGSSAFGLRREDDKVQPDAKMDEDPKDEDPKEVDEDMDAEDKKPKEKLDEAIDTSRAKQTGTEQSGPEHIPMHSDSDDELLSPTISYRTDAPDSPDRAVMPFDARCWNFAESSAIKKTQFREPDSGKLMKPHEFGGDSSGSTGFVQPAVERLSQC